MISEHVSQQDGEGERAWGGYNMTDGDCMCVSLCEYVNATALGLFLHTNKWKKITKYFIELDDIDASRDLDLQAVLISFQCDSSAGSALTATLFEYCFQFS